MSKRTDATVNGISLDTVRSYCRRKYNELRQTERCHPSHTASHVMMMAQKHYKDLGTFGVEGWCDQSGSIGSHGINYLNTGDSYCPTIFFDSDKERFYVSNWEYEAIRWEKKHGEIRF
jgi:hypothetical protein